MEASQRDYVLDILLSGGSITSKQANEKGITRLSGIIYVLRERGYNIKTTMKEVPSRWGNKKATVAEYTLIKDEGEQTA